MNYLISIIFMLLFTANQGKEAHSDLPRRVSKTIEKTYKTKKIALEKIKPGKAEKYNDLPGNFYRLNIPAHPQKNEYLYIGKVKTCRTGGCSLPSRPADGEDTEYFEYFMVFDAELKIKKIQIHNYQASHGHEITSRGWLKQFVGFGGHKSLRVGKEIDSLTGATVSVYAIANDVQSKTEILHQLLKNPAD